MDDDDILRCISELDAAVTKEGAQLLISCDDETRFYCQFTANKLGYLRAGIEMLRAGFEPLAPEETNTRIDMNYLVGKQGLLMKGLIRREDVDAAFLPLRRKATWKNRAAGFGCLALLICLAVCALIGVVQVFVWIFGK